MNVRLALFVALVAACGPAATGQGPTGPCTGTGFRCADGFYQQCVNDTWDDIEQCGGGEVCSLGVGCAACDPDLGRLCQGNAVIACNADGTLGGVLEQCADIEGCQNGSCGGSNCVGGQAAELIYVVDLNNLFLSFDPRTNQFHSIGTLNCPASASLPGWADPNPTPFSMSVDRNARAWVLYTSGEIFHVSTTDASCQSSGFVPGQLGYELFGMGFVVDTPSGTDEKLWISGGAADVPNSGNVGFVDPTSLQVTNVGPYRPSAEVGPELTGTGNAQLFGYFPDTFNTRIEEIDKSTGQSLAGWSMAGLGGQVIAWAFAHWGAKFYVFVTVDDGLGNLRTDVNLLNSVNGQSSTLLPNISYTIVGAGVSTCAPVIVQ